MFPVRDRIHVRWFVLALMIMAIAAAVAQAQTERPGWVDDPAREYPPGEYIVGVGSGDSAESADKAARANLIAGFRARIDSRATVVDTAEETFRSTETTYDRTTRTHRMTEIQASEELANITVGGTWQDDVTGRHFALVYLKRDEAAQTIRSEIQNRLARIGEILGCDGCYADVVVEYGAAVRAARLFEEYEGFSAQLRVVSEGREGESDASLGKRVDGWLAATSNLMTLRIEKAPPELEPTLRDALIGAGFRVVDGQALFTAELVYATEPAPHSDYFVFENWDMSLRLRRAGQSAEFVTLNKHDRAGHKSREAAQERCLREARQALVDEFGVDLDVFLAKK